MFVYTHTRVCKHTHTHSHTWRADPAQAEKITNLLLCMAACPIYSMSHDVLSTWLFSLSKMFPRSSIIYQQSFLSFFLLTFLTILKFITQLKWNKNVYIPFHCQMILSVQRSSQRNNAISSLSCRAVWPYGIWVCAFPECNRYCETTDSPHFPSWRACKSHFWMVCFSLKSGRQTQLSYCLPRQSSVKLNRRETSH